MFTFTLNKVKYIQGNKEIKRRLVTSLMHFDVIY